MTLPGFDYPHQIQPNSWQERACRAATTYNGWANYETWNASLWIQNDEFLYNTAKACVQYCGSNDTPWSKFVRCMMDGQIGRYLGATGDGVAWNDPAIDVVEMNDMMADLYEVA